MDVVTYILGLERLRLPWEPLFLDVGKEGVVEEMLSRPCGWPKYRGRVLAMSTMGCGMALQIGFTTLQLQPPNDTRVLL